MKTLIALSTLALAAAARANLTMSARANGSTAPGFVPATQSLINGDFTIQPNPGANVTGDGWDETTLWTFNLAADPNYAAVVQSGSLSAATLTITLTTGYDNGPITDLVAPGGGGFNLIAVPQFIPQAGTASIQFDLMPLWNSGNLLTYIAGNNGHLPMVYADDAIISHAEISLTAVPAPGTFALLGLAGLMLRRRR